MQLPYQWITAPHFPAREMEPGRFLMGGYYFNHSGIGIAIVAVITCLGDEDDPNDWQWAAYIGAHAQEWHTRVEAEERAMRVGVKLAGVEAARLFPNLAQLPYRR